MKTITKEYNVYTFNELTQEAKDKALQNNNNDMIEYSWWDDAIKTLEEWCKFFWGTFDYRQIDWLESYRNEYSVIIPYYIEEESEDDLKKYIMKQVNYGSAKYRKTWETSLYWCILTWYCLDDDFMIPINDFIEWRVQYDTLEEILLDCVSKVLKSAKNDYEYTLWEEYFTEECEANEYTFLEDGTLFIF